MAACDAVEKARTLVSTVGYILNGFIILMSSDSRAEPGLMNDFGAAEPSFSSMGEFGSLRMSIGPMSDRCDIEYAGMSSSSCGAGPPRRSKVMVVSTGG